MSEPTCGFDPVDDLVESFLTRYRRGERPSLTEYTDKHPELAERFRALLPALLVMEELGSRDGQATGSLPAQKGAEASMPQRLGDYVLLRAVGSGGMGIVYEAIQESLGRHVALKVLPFHHLGDATRLERFRREARAAARLHHTHIVPVHGIGEQDGLHFYTMQFIRGHGLDAVLQEVKRLRREPSTPGAAAALDGPVNSTILARALATGCFPANGSAPAETESPATGATSTGQDRAPIPPTAPPRLPEPRDPSGLSEQPEARYVHSVARIGAHVAEALEYAHQQGILHRDIKPSNLLLDTQGQIWITDFGLAKAQDSDELTRTGDIVGTLKYMAPERFNGWSDPRSDVYALGATLYEMLTLRPAFDESDRVRLIEQVLHESPPPLRQLDRRVPRDLETIVLKAIAKEPGERYWTAGQLAEDLRRFRAGRPILARRSSPLEQLWRWSKRNPGLAAATGAVAAAMAAVVVISLIYAREQSRANQRIRSLANEVTKSLADSNHLLAIRNFDRGQAAFEKDQIGPGLLWMIESWRSAATAGDQAWQHAARANLAAWQRYHPRLRAMFSHPKPVDAVAFSPDGKTIVTGSDDGTARAWDAATGRPVGSPLSHAGSVYAVAFSPDGRTLLTGCADKRARFWDVETRQSVGSPLEHANIVTGVAFSPDGKTVLTGSHDRTTQLWDAATHRPIGSPLRHRGNVNCVAFSPDGKAVFAGIGEMAHLWDTVTGQAIGTPMNHHQVVFAVAFSPDGKTLLTGCRGAFAQLWETATCQALGQRLWHRDRVRAVAFSPDSNRFLTGSTDNTAQLWDAATHQPIGSPIQHQGPVVSVAFSPDGKTFLTGSSDGTARLWQSEVYQPVKQEVGQGDCVHVAFGPDNRTVFTSGADGPWYWDAKTGLARDASWLHQARGWVGALGPDGKNVVTQSDGQTWRVWDGVTRKPLGLPMQERTKVSSFHLSPDGKTLILGCADRTVRLWDVKAGAPLCVPVATPGEADAVEFSPDGKSFLTGCDSGTAQLWDLATRAPAGKPFPHPGCVSAVAFSSSGKTVITGCEDGKARIWDVASRTLVVPPMAHPGWVWSVAFCPDGKTVATGCEDHKVRLWDVGTGKAVGASLPHGHTVRSLAFSPDGQTFVAGGGQARIFSNFSELPLDLDRVATWVEVLTGLTLDTQQGSIQPLDNEAWQARRERLLQLGGPPAPPIEDRELLAKPAQIEANLPIVGAELPIIAVGSFHDKASDTAQIAEFSPDGQRVLTGHEDGNIRLWECESGRLIRRFRGPGGWSMALAFSPDGRRALSGGDDKVVRLWDLDSGKPVREFAGHTEWIFNVAFSRDGRQAYSTSGGPNPWGDGTDSAVRVWDVESGREIRRLEGHKGRVLGLAISPDGRRVLTGGDTSLIFWDAESGRELRRLRGHTGLIGDVAFLPDGRRAISGSFDRTIRLWDLEGGEEIHRFLGHPKEVTWVAVSPDGRRLISSDYNGHELRLWDLDGRKLIHRIDWGGTSPTRGSFSPDGRHAVWCGTGGVVRTYRLQALDGANSHAAPVPTAEGKPEQGIRP